MYAYATGTPTQETFYSLCSHPCLAAPMLKPQSHVAPVPSCPMSSNSWESHQPFHGSKPCHFQHCVRVLRGSTALLSHCHVLIAFAKRGTAALLCSDQILPHPCRRMSGKASAPLPCISTATLSEITIRHRPGKDPSVLYGLLQPLLPLSSCLAQAPTPLGNGTRQLYFGFSTEAEATRVDSPLRLLVHFTMPW